MSTLLQTLERNLARLEKMAEVGGTLGIAAFSIRQDLLVEYKKLKKEEAQ